MCYKRAGISRGPRTVDIDLILSDNNVPKYSGLKALELAKTVAPACPFIILSGSIGEEVAVGEIKAGCCRLCPEGSTSPTGNGDYPCSGRGKAKARPREGPRANTTTSRLAGFGSRRDHRRRSGEQGPILEQGSGTDSWMARGGSHRDANRGFSLHRLHVDGSGSDFPAAQRRVGQRDYQENKIRRRNSGAYPLHVGAKWRR